MIGEFKGNYSFLSNFYEAPVTFEGLTYKNSEAAFQAAKTLSREQFTDLDPKAAKELGRKVILRPDWEEIKDDIMYQICVNKFLQNPDLLEKLLATGNEELVYGNTEGDRIWGMTEGEGENCLGKILMQIRGYLAKGFKPEQAKTACVEWIRQFFEQNGPNCNAVIGISGGKDSTIAAALCVEALGRDRVIGVLLPNGIQSDIDDAMQVVRALNIKYHNLNINVAVQHVLEEMTKSNIDISSQTRFNLPARIRMSMLYAVSQSCNGRVVNTCNLSEDWVGYSTRYGDAAGDFSPLSDFTVTEIKEIGRVLNLPVNLIEKVPSDGLCGKTDEDNLGFSYKALDRYIRTGICENAEIKARIDKMHNKNLFKLQMMPGFKYK